MTPVFFRSKFFLLLLLLLFVDPHLGLVVFFISFSTGYIFFSQVPALQAATCCLVINHQRINIAFWGAMGGWHVGGEGSFGIEVIMQERKREKGYSGREKWFVGKEVVLFGCGLEIFCGGSFCLRNGRNEERIRRRELQVVFLSFPHLTLSILSIV